MKTQKRPVYEIINAITIVLIAMFIVMVGLLVIELLTALPLHATM